jgi:hypothetical protein
MEGIYSISLGMFAGGFLFAILLRVGTRIVIGKVDTWLVRTCVHVALISLMIAFIGVAIGVSVTWISP